MQESFLRAGWGTSVDLRYEPICHPLPEQWEHGSIMPLQSSLSFGVTETERRSITSMTKISSRVTLTMTSLTSPLLKFPFDVCFGDDSFPPHLSQVDKLTVVFRNA